jgi:guanosine-3',5'-bis(diphosphate) 3'-pyrophosphohydrolase
MNLRLERALRMAAVFHRPQERRASGVPYIEHPAAVAMILDRLGFAEDVVIAGLLHDAVEDTELSLEQIHDEFGAQVAEIVHFCTERKLDDHGRKRPWIDRKRDHLADKLHNLLSIRLDLEEGRDVWSTFNAHRDQVLWYYRTTIDQLGEGDSRLEDLADACRAALDALPGMADD